MVNLTRIYTRTGDDGTTALGDMSRTTQDRPAAGRVRRRRRGQLRASASRSPLGELPDDVVALLDRCRTTCSTSAPTCARRASRTRSTRRCGSTQATSTGSRPPATSYNERLAKLRSFVLPGGTPGAALLHVARTVARRAERSTWAALRASTRDTMNPLTARYLNRLSDLLFILARDATSSAGGDVLWMPGGQPVSPERPGRRFRALEHPELLAAPVRAALGASGRSPSRGSPPRYGRCRDRPRHLRHRRRSRPRTHCRPSSP